MKFVALLLPLFLFAPDALACPICVSRPLKFAFQDAELFFVGTVTGTQQRSVTFAVKEQFVGEPRAEVTLSTASSCSMSGFSLGATYLVEAVDHGHGLYAHCGSHTQVVDGENRDLRLVRRRASWWKSPLSRVSWYRLRLWIGRHIGS